MSNDRELDSITELRTFIDENDLRDNQSRVMFEAIIHFNIKGKQSYEEERVRIHIQDGIKAGMIYFDNVDQNKYPDNFQAYWNVYKYIPGTGLTIENDGKHPRFGKFHITISPK